MRWPASNSRRLVMVSMMGSRPAGDDAVGLDRDRDAACMQRVGERRVHLKQRFAAREDHEAVRALGTPVARDLVGEGVGAAELAAAVAVGADEIGVAERADRARAI